ncbi:MAG: YbhN family protein [Roseiarcus sp.]
MAQQSKQRLPRDESVHDPRSAESADRIARWAAAIEARRPLLRRLGFAFSLLIITFSAIVFVRTLIRIDPQQFKAAFAATGGDQIAMAFGLSAMSYLALTGYDGLALKHLKVHVPYRLTALASFTSYAVSFTLGFPLVTGAAVRFWIYGPAGLSGGKVACVTVVAGFRFWLGLGIMVGVGFLAEAVAVG